MVKKVKGGKSYLMIDNRASGGKLLEFNTMTCAHCHMVVALNPERKRPRGYCPKCDAYICDDRVCTTYCAPIEKCIELAQKHPGLPTLPRDKQGGLLFDPDILKQDKPY